MKYKHLFFDLDRTLWDFDRNSAETLLELFEAHHLSERTDHAPEEFVNAYQAVNERLWARYRAGTIQKEELRSTRFRVAFSEMEIDDPAFADQFGVEYLKRCPLKTNLVEGAEALLGELHGKYNMHLITNGFQETQAIKIKAASIERYFEEVITSEAAGARKPDPAIFELALIKSGASLKNSVMIGDDLEADIIGAKEFGMDQIHYRRNGSPEGSNAATHTVTHLDQVSSIL